jgi:hypothetical protein
MTVLEIVNRVLRRLRETTVSDLQETEYSSLVTELLIDVHAECMDHDWSSMEHTVDVPVNAAQRVVDLSRLVASGGNVDPASRLPTSESVLTYDDDGTPQCWVFDSSSDTTGTPLGYVSPPALDQLYQEDRANTGLNPSLFSLRNHPDRSGLELTLWPAPTATRHIRIRLWTPESPIQITTDETRQLLVPDRPLVQGTLYLALNERGEEIGEPGNIAERRYDKALAAAIEQDVNRRSMADRYTAQRV